MQLVKCYVSVICSNVLCKICKSQYCILNSVKQEKIGRKHNRIMKMGWHDMVSVHTLCPPLANVNIFVLPLGRRS